MFLILIIKGVKHYLPLPTADLPLWVEFHILAALVLAALSDIPLALKESLIFS